MRKTTRTFLSLLLPLTLCLLACSCVTFPWKSLGPVEPFQVQPTTTGELARNLIGRHPPVPQLWAKMRITASGGPIGRKMKLNGYLKYMAPDQIMLQGNLNFLGPMLRVTQNGEDASVYLMREPVHFYKGSLEELNTHPEFLYGLQPTDIVRTLLIGREIVELLQTQPLDTALPPGAHKKSKHWVLLTTPAWNRMETYAIRKKDGLTKEVLILDENGARRILVTYHRYAYFNDALYPKEFDLLFAGSNLKLRVSVDEISSESPHGKEIFDTNPPANSPIEAEPMSNWFDRPDLAPMTQ